jgi:hypothetical protein
MRTRKNEIVKLMGEFRMTARKKEVKSILPLDSQMLKRLQLVSQRQLVETKR